MAYTGPKNPFVFVVGCPRSGTTLLQRMLDNHPDLAVANDTHFILRAARRVLRKYPDPGLSEELIQQVISYRRFHRMGLDEDQVRECAAGCDSYGSFVSRLYDLRGSQHGKRLSGEKTPDYCRNIPVLHRLFPGTKFVHIIRDGRDTASSAMAWATATKGPGKWSLWQQDPVAGSALWWRWQTGAGVENGRALGKDLYHETFYEKLVAEPAAILLKIADFLRIPYSEQMTTYYQGRTRNNPKLSAKSAWLPPTSGLRDWRTQMAEEDLAVFEAIAGNLLEQLGYELSGAQVSGSGSARVEAARSWWRQQPMSAAGKKPRRSG